MTMTRDRKIIFTSIIGIIGNVLLVGAKAFIGLISGSVSIILDALNNLTDALSSIITIVGTKVANKKPDAKHPYGHGRIEYVTSLAIAVIILVAGGTAIYRSILSLIEGQTANYDYTAIIIVSIAILVKVAIGLFFRKVGKETNSNALKGSGIDALFDALLSLATLIGAIVAMTTGVYIEGYLGILIGLFIIKSGIEVLRESISNIIGERTSKETSLAIKKMVCSHKGVLGAYDLILNNYGPNKAIGSIHIEVDDEMTAKEIHPLSREIQAQAYLEFGVILTVGIYASNNKHPEVKEIRKYIYQLVKEYEEIKEIHGFYVDVEKKIINFDLVMLFSEKSEDETVNDITKKLNVQYPEYTTYIVVDHDFAD